MRASIIVLAALLASAVPEAGAGDLAVPEVLRAISKEINRSVPIRVDNEKELETSVVMFDTLVFKYKFTDETTISNPRFSKDKYLAALRVSLGESTCMDESTFALLKRGAKYNYLFTTKRGFTVFEYTLDHKVCASYRKSRSAKP